MIVNLGPQSVQVMNGWRYRRLPGSNSSRRQALHVGTWGGTRVRWLPAFVEATIRKPSSTRGATGSALTAVIRASGGGSADSRRVNSERVRGDPCASMNTAAASLPTNPVTPSSVASRCTNGRNPTPCTTPVTVILVRTASPAGVGGSAPDVTVSTRVVSPIAEVTYIP